jgi:hypothetical protein
MFNEMAEKGDLSNIDLTIGDITREEIAGLRPTRRLQLRQDQRCGQPRGYRAGHRQLVFQSIGTSAVMAARQSTCVKLFLPAFDPW